MRAVPLFTASLLAASVAVPAAAQTTWDNEEQSWSGVYVGGTVGLAAQKNDRGETVVFDTNRDGTYGEAVTTVAGANAFSPGFCNGAARTAVPGNCTGDKDGLEYSVRVGADAQSGNIVYGVVVEGTKNEARDSVTAFSTTPASYTLTRELDYSVGARGRLGYAAKGVLFYGTGGVTYGRIDNSFATTNTANAFSTNGKSNSWGYTYGGGAEAKIMPNMTLGLEYLYTRFNEDDFVVGVTQGNAAATNPFLLNGGGTNMKRNAPDFSTHGIRLTASVRF